MSILNFLIVLVGSLCSGGVIGVLFQGLFSRKGERANAAKSISEVATSVNTLNLDLRKEMRELKEAVTILSDTIDQILDEWSIEGNSHVSPSQKNRLRVANARVKIVS